jgi:hypothetical protein
LREHFTLAKLADRTGINKTRLFRITNVSNPSEMKLSEYVRLTNTEGEHKTEAMK